MCAYGLKEDVLKCNNGGPNILYAQPSGTVPTNQQYAPDPPIVRTKPPFYPEQRRVRHSNNEALEPLRIKVGK
jgi:hypothetical protein